jgi:hypothetical protein
MTTQPHTTAETTVKTTKHTAMNIATPCVVPQPHVLDAAGRRAENREVRTAHGGSMPAVAG